MRISKHLLEEIYEKFPIVPPEAGCVLGGHDDVVTHFFYERGISSRNDFAIYTPDVKKIAEKIREWEKEGIEFLGLAHSHPSGQTSLSSSDAAYIHAIMNANPTLLKVYFPLIFSEGEFISYVAVRSEKIKILPDDIIF